MVLVLASYSLFNIVWGLIEKYKEVQNFTGKNKEIEMSTKTNMVKDDNVFQLEDINCEKRGKWLFDNYSPDNLEQNRVIWSKGLNIHLWDNDIELKIDPVRKKKVKKFILKNREILTPFLQYKYYNSRKNNQLFFNESKLCMSSDINPSRSYIKCYRSDYFNSFLTNEISTSVLKRVEDATIIYDASNFFPCEYNKAKGLYYLQPIDKCEMNNHIGISTLAVTTDNYLVIRKQATTSQQNINKYVPTGSGSCDWSDMQKDSFCSTIEFAMKRELWEENGGKELNVSVNEFGETKILGFYRWLQRGGKPEFVGITKLNFSQDQLDPDSIELIDTNNKAIPDTFYIESVTDLPHIISEIKEIGNVSLPLHMCLDALEHFYEERSSELEQLLNL
ncbi:hypothetical protein [Alkalibacillus silvisoli]|uniref:hypothetical protein n=1 Tax=Alkalibacillus silvisoli TaxID=392823 RepID=UPI0031D62511